METKNMETMTALPELVAQAKEGAEQAKARLLRTFEFVPEDKLRWSPSSSARTALQIVAHCGLGNRAFAAIIRGEEMPLSGTPQEAAVQIRASDVNPATREEAVAMVEDSVAEVLEALDGVTDEMLDTTPTSPFGPLPFAYWMGLSSNHTGFHTAQIEYLQTIWGDLESH